MTTMSHAAVPVPRLDRLSALLEGLAPEVTVRHLSAAPALPPSTGPMPTLRPSLRLYLLMSGRASLQQDGRHEGLASPSLVICRSDTHHCLTPEDGTVPVSIVLVEACLRGPAARLLLDAFDEPFVIPLVDAETSLLHTVGLIAAELEQPRCGQPALLHRAGDILFIGVLRQLVARPTSTVGGVLSGLADPRLARALVAIHVRPQAHWTLERLAVEAGMSRTAFAKHFHAVMRLPPGRYLQVVRLAIARSEVIAGRGLKQAAQASGYQSAAALSRALSRPSVREHHAQQAAVVQ
ncbi:AraC family transcriptional regulator [Polaromonas sp. YR568]|uniref:AraC family transcriptional regulator n=1 Tax=Polaromonas sp. YR568 TaxID=1855301 RepID=UPI0031377E83